MFPKTGNFNHRSVDFCLCPNYSGFCFVLFSLPHFFPNYFAAQFRLEYDFSRLKRGKEAI